MRAQAQQRKHRLRYVIAIAAAAVLLLLIASGKSFTFDDEPSAQHTGGANRPNSGNAVRTFEVPADANLQGKQLQDIIGKDSTHIEEKKRSAGGVTNSKDNQYLLEPFLKDPSVPTRCKETSAPAKLDACAAVKIERLDKPLPPLMVPFSTGQTTSGMVLKPATEVLKNSSIRHHPIFDVYGQNAAVGKWEPTRVLEFNGVHTEYGFDCEAGMDFRLYHQCRAALCLEHESKLKSDPEGLHVGQYPLVDEEYMEYVMTLTTAHEAAKNGKPYTFIELGARYGTWIVRAGASFKSFDPVGALHLLAVEGNCHWYRKMEEHVRCNNLEQDSQLILSYAAPKSYNKVDVAKPDTFNQPRAVSLLEMLPVYDFVDMIDFDIQGFEWLAIEEPGVLELMTEKIGFAHFGTHSTEIEKRVVTAMQQHGWCVVYFYAGAHTKKLDRGHRCETPFGPSVFNDGVLGLANFKFYPQLKGKCPKLSLGNLKSVAKTCHHNFAAVTNLLEKVPTETVH